MSNEAWATVLRVMAYAVLPLGTIVALAWDKAATEKKTESAETN